MTWIETSRLILRDVAASDLVAMHDLYADPAVMHFIPRFPSKSLEETESYFFNNIFPLYKNNQSYYYAVVLKTKAEAIGYITLNDLAGANDFGYALRKEFWYEGYIHEVGQFLFKHWKSEGLAYITATHDILNLNSGRVMQKLGMKYQYSYKEIVQPKNYWVTFRLYQYNFTPNFPQYSGYAERYGSFKEIF